MRLLTCIVLFLLPWTSALSETDAHKSAVWQAMQAVANSDKFIEERREREFKDGYVLPLLYCPADDRECRQYQAGVIVDADFAYRGDYYAQRNFADCLASGCGLIDRQPTLSCAWRTVILASGSPLVSGSDITAREECLAQLGELERATAKSQAGRLFRAVYQEELPSEWR